MSGSPSLLGSSGTSLRPKRALANACDGCRVVIGAEYGCSSDNHVGTGIAASGISLSCPWVHLDPWIEDGNAETAQIAYFRQHFRQKCLAAKPPIDVITRTTSQTQHVFNKGDGAGGIQYPLPLSFPPPECATARGGGGSSRWFGLNKKIGTGLGKRMKIAFRIDDHQMHIERFRSRAYGTYDCVQPNEMFGNEPPIHDSDVKPIGTSLIGRTNFAEPPQIGRQDGGSDDDGSLCLHWGRAPAGQNEALNRFGKAFVVVRLSDQIGLSLHLRAGVPHGDAEAALAKHQHVVRHVPNCGYLDHRNRQEL
jgi:hypothetical protein